MANRKRAVTDNRPKSRDTETTSPTTSRSEIGSDSKAASAGEQSRNATDFQFLNFSHPSEAKASRARRAVRSHVTRQQHQREQAAAAARRAQSTPQSPTQSVEVTQPTHAATFPLSRPPPQQMIVPEESSPSSSSSGRSSEASPPPPATALSTILPSRRINISEAYPEEWHPDLPRIIEHYLANMAVDIPDLDGPETRGLLRTRFFPFILTDPASLHAVVLIAASHYSNVHGPRSHAIDTLSLRGMAIREINHALEDRTRATSDQLITAVAKIASYEALFGDRNISHTHMTALARLVALRGGLGELGLDGLLERILLWVDANAAYITGSRCYFDRQTMSANVRHPRPDPLRFAGGLPRQPPPAA